MCPHAQGVLMVKPKDGFGKANMVRLWVHESLRVFGDRLVDDPDREWFLQHLNGMVRQMIMSLPLHGRFGVRGTKACFC